MVFHYLSKRRAAMGPGWLLSGRPWGWNLLCRPAVVARIYSAGPPWVWNGKISKKFLFSLQFIQQK